MLGFTYDKYVVPYLHYEEPGGDALISKQHLPDQIIDVMKVLAPRFDAHSLAYEQQAQAGGLEVSRTLADENGKPWRSRIYIPRPAFSREETLALTSQSLACIDPAMASRLETAVQNGWLEEKIAHAPGFTMGMVGGKDWTGHTDGRLATIFMTWDGTINDPVYLAHEVGHYNALVARGNYLVPESSNSGIGKIVGELQAFFPQNSFYDPVLHADRSIDIAHAIDLQRQAEIYHLGKYVSDDVTNLELRNTVPLDDRTEGSDGYAVLEKAYRIHGNRHNPGNLLAAASYSRYRDMNAREQQEFISLLYPAYERFPENNGFLPLTVILSSLGVETEAGLVQLFAEGAEYALRLSLAAEPVPAALKALNRSPAPIIANRP